MNVQLPAASSSTVAPKQQYVSERALQSRSMFLFGSWIADSAATVAVVSGIIYFWVTSRYDFWKKMDVPYVKPSFPFGNTGKQLIGKVSVFEMFEELYIQLKENDYGGIFNLREPVLLICKPELIKQVLTKDFSSFHDRGFRTDEKNDPLGAHLFNLGGARWRTLRAKLSPAFTSGKIKVMFPLIQEVTNELKDCIRKEMQKNSSVQLLDLLERYTADVIGTCAFGVSFNSLKNPKSEFLEMARTFTRPSFSVKIALALVTSFPVLKKFITFGKFFSKTTGFFSKLMAQTVKYRKENNVERKDFVQLMMKILAEDTDGQGFSQDVMTAQAILFFLAGLDNVSVTVGHCLHAMAVDTDLQNRVYDEIDTVLKDNKGELSYEALQKMNLVARVIDESLRMYSPSAVLIREVTDANYAIPGTNTVLKRGTKVMIPIQAIFSDEEYFPNPRKFEPDRFIEEEKAKRHPYTYIPFGEGPRFCIASRFALLEVRLCIVELIRQFRFSVASETDVSMTIDKKSFFAQTPKKGFWFCITEHNAGNV